MQSYNNRKHKYCKPILNWFVLPIENWTQRDLDRLPPNVRRRHPGQRDGPAQDWWGKGWDDFVTSFCNSDDHLSQHYERTMNRDQTYWTKKFDLSLCNQNQLARSWTKMQDPPQSFMQNFVLKPSADSFFIQHDVFRLVLHNVAAH